MEKYAIRQHIDLEKLEKDVQVTENVKIENGILFLSYIDEISQYSYLYKYESEYEWSMFENEKWMIISPMSYPNFYIESEKNPNEIIFEKVENDIM